eukprot:gene787-328_t
MLFITEGYELYVKFSRPKLDTGKETMSWEQVLSELQGEGRNFESSELISNTDFLAFITKHGEDDHFKKFCPFFHPSTLKSLGDMPRVVVDEWLFSSRRFFALYQFLRSKYPSSFPDLLEAQTDTTKSAGPQESNVLERHGFVAKFQLPTFVDTKTNSPQSPGASSHEGRRTSFSAVSNELVGLFKMFEDQKESLGVAEYSLSPTSLDEVFQMFARQQADAYSAAHTMVNVSARIVNKTPPKPINARPWINILQPNSHRLPSWGSPDQSQYAKKLFYGNTKVVGHPVLVASNVDKLRSKGHVDLPQVCIVGRSNVGKSTLINYLMYGRIPKEAIDVNQPERKRLKEPTIAPVSHLPGRTRHLFRFDLDKKMTLVDLPGYGHAMVNDTLKREWATLIEDYLENSAKSIKRVVSLIDATEGVCEDDEQLWEMMMEKDKQTMVVLTKTDCLKPMELHEVMSDVIEKCRALPKETFWPTRARDWNGLIICDVDVYRDGNFQPLSAGHYKRSRVNVIIGR